MGLLIRSGGARQILCSGGRGSISTGMSRAATYSLATIPVSMIKGRTLMRRIFLMTVFLLSGCFPPPPPPAYSNPPHPPGGYPYPPRPSGQPY
jgi:hypothetical protein